jgi:DNA ligase-1
MKQRLRAWLAALLAAAAVLAAQAQPAAPPPLMLASIHHPGLHLPDYWVSEKLDGVRGRWDGQRLISRGGLPIAAPAWFTQGWPPYPLDGELWMGRGRFEATVSVVRAEIPNEAGWRQLRFMVFDLPAHGGPFSARIQAMATLPALAPSGSLQVIAQHRVDNNKALQSLLRQTVQAGGEGLMLHRGDALYQAGRSGDLLKLKPFDDAEAQVLGHEPGQGKYRGQTGALRVRTADGRRFKLGSGLSDAMRSDPPPVGTWVTYRFRGLNASGLPRFANFLRVRTDMPLQAPEGAETLRPAPPS